MAAPKLYRPQELAMLVLGYLEEEDCPSAYNEFIKCSPHLDDFRRDYSSAIMSTYIHKSLKDVFGEYCSYKSSTHNCKFPELRKTLNQFKTLLDTVHQFMEKIDVKILQVIDERHQCPSSNNNVQSQNSRKACEMCRSDSCECRSRSDAAYYTATQHERPLTIREMPLDTSDILPNVLVETTQLSDLPGTIPGTGGMSNTTVTSKDYTDSAGDINHTLNLQVGQSSHWPTNSGPATTKAMHTGETSAQDFALVVRSGHSVGDVTSSSVIPDSCTPEANIFQSSSELQSYHSHRIASTTNRRQSLCRTQEQCADISNRDSVALQSTKNPTPTISPKITILSDDVIETTSDGALILKKDGKTLRRLPGKPPGLKVSNSTPKSVVHINGVPVYRTQEVFTKEQIMAMPTVIVLQPTSEQFTAGTSRTINTIAPVRSAAAPTPVLGPSDTCQSSLPPITIDIKPTSQPVTDFSKNLVPSASVPTETVSLQKTSTPNNPLVAKKAASTPRRNSSSHVRVLDFTTPRRILPLNEDSEVSNKDQAPPAVSQMESETVKIDTVKKTKKSNWDADLRALLPSYDPPPPKKPKAKKKSPVKNETADKVKKRRKSRKKSEDNNVKDVQCEPSKSERNTDNDGATSVQETVQNKSGGIKPTINLIHKDREPVKSIEPIPVDTPENDFRPPDSNPPSAAKHNLSDLFLLQTPYKMMVDNLQMETPRFIDPSVFDVPMSDIKIDNIPTPHFLSTPNLLLSAGKGVAVTPSSYSSRPTDYSSGGSYYRPDEHDFHPSPDLKPSSPSVSASTSKTDSVKTPKSKVKKDSPPQSSRPRRQCTLKVSRYFESRTASDTKSAQSVSRSSRSLSISSNASDSSDSTVKSRTLTQNTSDTAKEKGKGKENKNVNKSKDEILASLDAKRRRTIVSLRKTTPVKRKRNSAGSFPKVKLSATKLQVKKPKTVAELRRTITPRKMANLSKDKSKKKALTKVDLSLHSASTSTKSRRKSSTPRKVDKFLLHSLDDSASADAVPHKNEVNLAPEEELPPLRMSFDDGSQDSRLRKHFHKDEEESEDISQIRAYIETTAKVVESVAKADKDAIAYTQSEDVVKMKSSLETTESNRKEGVQEFVQRGFDIETAKSIERDLLNAPGTGSSDEVQSIIVDIREQLQTTRTSKIIVTIEQSPQHVPTPESQIHSKSSIHSTNHNESLTTGDNLTPKTSSKNESSVLMLENDIVMVRETFSEISTNHFNFCHDENNEKDKFEIDRIDKDFAIDVLFEDVKLNVCLVEQVVLFDFAPKEMNENTEASMTHNNLQTNEISSVNDRKGSSSSSSDSDEETLNAVRSITNMKSPFTSLDTDSNLHRQTCIDIFDSTLNSLDTPIKNLTKSGNATPYSEDDRTYDNVGTILKRKKPSISPIPTESSDSTSKKNRPDHQTLIQCVDIESFLSKLHGDKE